MPDHDALVAALGDRYEIERELGRGGFAVVYLARDVRHDRRVALKVLHDEVAQTVGRERFEREVKLVARLQHPHILGVFDSGEVDGRLWFTMPFIEGETLRARLTRERQLPLKDALQIAGEVADALDYAHQHGVVHRDIKPENILLSGRHALVADFGIARALAGGGDTQSLTMTGMGIGTPGYMSPEQAMGSREVDARTDLYALGCVLYEMLAGEPPFSGPTAQAVIARVLSEDPRPLGTTRPGLPPLLEGVIRKAMARVQADRYAGAAEFAAAIEQASQSAMMSGALSGAYAAGAASTASPSVAAAPPARAGVPKAAYFAIGLLIGLGALFAWRRANPGGDGPPALAVLPFESVGTAEDIAFAEGITEEVRGKLASVPGLKIIARASSNQYKGSTKSPHDIGQELGVQYLLTGTVRWSTGADGVKRVRVTPELIKTRDGSTPWQAPFDEELKDVFKVQSQIATNVASQLNVALGEATREQLASRPTDELPAYKEFLLGEQATDRLAKADRASVKAGLEHYERAVALDSNFAEAWARIAMIYASNLTSTYTTEDRDRARTAMAHATRLAPRAALSAIARSRVATLLDKDFALASAILDTAAREAPGNPDVIGALARANAVAGRFDQAAAMARRSAPLDPRNSNAVSRAGNVLHATRHYAAAESMYVRAAALSPFNVSIAWSRSVNFMSMGDSAASTRVIAETLQRADTNELVAYYALFQEAMWMLPPPLLRRITTLTPANFFGNRQQWALKLGRTWLLLGDEAKARAYGDSSVQVARAQLASNPDDAQIWELLGRALVLAGRNAEAIEYADKALKVRETEQDATQAGYIRYQAARIYIQAGATDKALNLIEPLMTMNYSDLTPAWLRLEPVFRPLKGNPRFEKLAAGT
ncbi:MAG: protein kinase [Gemmatimonadetes bacterium]|nr:protein kinase [Gemmatimonadota bacterium]